MDKRTLGLLIAGFCTTFTAFAARYSYGVLLPEMLPAMSITKTEAGVIFTSYFVAYTLFSPLLGLLGDRYNARALLTSFMAIIGIGAFLMSTATSVLAASFFFALVGIGHSACWGPLMALVARWISDKRRGMVMAFIDLGSGLGIASGGFLLPLVVAAYDWTAGWVSLGILGFLVTVINFSLIRNSRAQKPGGPQTAAVKRTPEPVRVTYMKMLRSRKFWFIATAYMLVGFSIIIPFTFLSTYAVQELAVPYRTAATLITIVGIAAMTGKATLGTLSDRVGRIKVMMACSVLIAAGSLGMIYSRELLTLGMFTFIFGLGYGTVWPMYAAAASDYFSKENTGSVVGLWTVFLGVGAAISPVAAGWLGDTTGTLRWSFLMAMVAAAVSLLLLIPILKVPTAEAQ